MSDGKQVYSTEGISQELRVEDTELAKSYKDLNVYRLAFEAAMRIFELSKKWPPDAQRSTDVKWGVRSFEFQF